MQPTNDTTDHANTPLTRETIGEAFAAQRQEYETWHHAMTENIKGQIQEAAETLDALQSAAEKIRWSEALSMSSATERLMADPKMAGYLSRAAGSSARFIAAANDDRRLAKCLDADYRDAVIWREDAKAGHGSLVVREHTLMLDAVGDAEVERVLGLLGTGRVPAELVRVIDGDTYVVRVAGEEFRVRTVGFDCPEVNKVGHALPEVFAQEATDAAQELLVGARVEIQLDSAGADYEAGPFIMDRYGRLLAHVYANGTLLAEPLVEQGLARVVRGFPIEAGILDELTILQGEARAANRGLWAHVTPTKKTAMDVVREYDAADRQYSLRVVSEFLTNFTLAGDSGVLHVPGCPHIGRMKSPTSVSSPEEARALLVKLRDARPCKTCFRDEDNRAEAQDAVDAVVEDVRE